MATNNIYKYMLPIQKDNSDDRYSVIMAISYSGVVDFYIQHIPSEGNVDGNVFFTFLISLVNKIRKEQVLFLNNASFHHNSVVEMYLKTKGVRTIYNAPYHPKFSGVELIFNNMIWKIKDYETSSLPFIEILYQVIASITDDLCFKCINHSYNHCNE